MKKYTNRAIAALYVLGIALFTVLLVVMRVRVDALIG